MSELLKINVNDHTEKKGSLTYLSWAWAWAEVLKVDPAATWIVHMYGPQGAEQPCMWIGETAMVHTSVTVNGLRRECLLPVMDNRNNAMKNPDSRKISDAIMRCMTKAISMHGLGLYIYAGEDLPETDEPAPEKDEPAPERKHDSISVRHAVRDGIGDDLPEDWKIYLGDLAQECQDLLKAGQPAAAAQRIARDKLDADQKTYLFNKLDSKARSAIKQAEEEIRKAFGKTTKVPA